MIVDCYTHVWDSPNQLGRLADSLENGWSVSADVAGGRTPQDAAVSVHLAASRDVDATVVLGFKSHYLGAEIPNDTVAAYVQSHPDRLLGCAGIDPSVPGEALEEIDRAGDDLGMKGIALAPAAQDLHPCDSRAEFIYERAAERQMPVFFHPGIHIAKPCKLAYAQPVLLDEVARNYPTLKIVVAHLGYPWINETLVLLAKHDNVFSDISWLLHQPLQVYQALLSAHQYGVIDKLLFGSGFPYSSPAQSTENLYSINHLCAGTNLPKIPREALRGIVERDALELLGLPPLTPVKQSSTPSTVLDEDG